MTTLMPVEMFAACSDIAWRVVRRQINVLPVEIFCRPFFLFRTFRSRSRRLAALLKCHYVVVGDAWDFSWAHVCDGGLGENALLGEIIQDYFEVADILLYIMGTKYENIEGCIV